MATDLPTLQDVTVLSESPRIVRILGGNPGKFTLQGTNTYLIGSASNLTLIDTAQGEPGWVSSLRSHLPDGARITRTILTHWHADHTCGLHDLLNLAAAKDTSIHKAQPKYLGYGDHAERMQSYIDAGKVRFDQWQDIKDGEEFDVYEGWRLKALHTPGHTADHMSFALLSWQGDTKGVFTGDNVLGHGTAVFEDLSAYMNTLSKTLDAVPTGGKTPLYPGHGEVIADGRAKLEEYISHRKERERQVLGCLKNEGAGKSMTSMGIVKVVYKEYPESLHIPAEGGVRQVLSKLLNDGRVSCDDSGEDELWKAKDTDAGKL